MKVEQHMKVNEPKILEKYDDNDLARQARQ